MKQKIYFIFGGGLIVILAGVFWWWQKSQSPVVYESKKIFEAEAAKEEEQKIIPQDTVEEITENDNKEEGEAEKESEEKGSEVTPEEKKTEEKEEEDALPKKFAIKSKTVSFGYEVASDREIDTIVLHSSHAVSDDPYSVDAVIALWKSYGVAPHYMIARDGTVYQLVSDKNIAYHAGDSKMPDGRTGVNNFSLGVEILNTKTDEYTTAQYQAVQDLISYLKGKYGKMQVVGHNTIAPGRKTDPWGFDWDKL